MRKITSALFLLGLSASANGADTLKAFNPIATAPVALQFPASAPGFVTGHNSYYDEEWGEKYYINGSRRIVGMLAYHAGQAGTSTQNCFYKVYDVAPDAMPGAALATRTGTIAALDISGAPVYVSLPGPVTVRDSFFVSFGVPDYAHGGAGTKLVAIRHAPDGTRPAADTNRIGRNVVRWHDHDDIVWKDYYKENYTPLRIHLALFPVMAVSTSVNEYLNAGGLKVYAPYPSPAGASISLRIEGREPTSLNCSILDLSGRTLQSWTERIAQGATTISRNVSELSTGRYIMLVQTPDGQSAQQFIKQ